MNLEDITKDFLYLANSNQKTLEQIVLKVQEEVGEISSALLSASNSYGSEYKNCSYEDVIEESIDAMLVLGSLLVRLNVSEEVLLSVLRSKLDKWSEKTSKKFDNLEEVR